LRELIFALLLATAIISATVIVRHRPAHNGQLLANLLLSLSCLSPFWLGPLGLRYEVACRKVRDVRFLYSRLKDHSGLPPLESLRLGLRSRHSRSMFIAGIFISCGVVGLVLLIPAVRAFILTHTRGPVSVWWVIPCAAAAFFGIWAFFDSALGLYRVTRGLPLPPQTAEEILRRELPRIHASTIGELVMRRGMKVLCFPLALIAIAGILYDP
jgi:hypothetical protein